MSYILDALKSSQRDREQHNVPNLNTEQPSINTNIERSTIIRPALLLGSILILLGGGIGWWYSSSPFNQKNPIEQNVHELKSPSIIDQVIMDPSLQSVKSESRENDPIQNINLVDHKENHQLAEDSVKEPTPLKPNTEASTVALPDKVLDSGNNQIASSDPSSYQEEKSLDIPSTTDQSKIEEEDIATVIINDHNKGLPATQKNPIYSESQPSTLMVSKKDFNEETAPETDSDLTPILEEPEPESVPHFRELPYSIQAELPPITYSVHLYSKDPEKRMVKIGGLIRREGSEVFPGIFISEITPYGAVFTYREYSFRVPLN